jgi:hypothetical protein
MSLTNIKSRLKKFTLAELKNDAKRKGFDLRTISRKEEKQQREALINYIAERIVNFRENSGILRFRFTGLNPYTYGRIRQIVKQNFPANRNFIISFEENVDINSTIADLPENINEIFEVFGPNENGYYNITISQNDVLIIETNRGNIIIRIPSYINFNENDYGYLIRRLRPLLKETSHFIGTNGTDYEDRIVNKSNENIFDNIYTIYQSLAQKYTNANFYDIIIEAQIQEEQPLGDVGKCKIENCVISHLTRKDSIYKKYPHLEPADKTIYINRDTIREIARIEKANLRFYTPFGYIIDKTWEEFNYGNKSKIYDFIVKNKHAYLQPTKKYVKNVKYIKHIPDRTNKMSSYEDTHYIIEDTIYKIFKPSSISKNLNDDSKFFYCFTPLDFLYKKFNEDKNIQPTICYKQEIKESGIFPKRTLLKATNKKVAEYDQVKSYNSYKQCEFYMGFPNSHWYKYPTIIDSDLKPAFIKIANIKFNNKDFKKCYLNFYKKYHSTLTYPLYRFLKRYATIIIDYVIYADFIDLDHMEFLRQFNLQDDKLLRTSILGKYITGGLKETKKYKFTKLSQNDIDQMKFECYEKKVSYSQDEDSIKIKVPKLSRAAFHIYSYILTYSQIQVLQKYYDLSKQYTVVALNTDSITVELDDDAYEIWEYDIWTDQKVYSGLSENTHEKTQEGNFTRQEQDCLKEYYNALEITDIKTIKFPISVNIPMINYLPPAKIILLLGPGGIGKTTHIIEQQQEGLIILTYTLALRDALRETYKNTYCTQAYNKKGNRIERANIVVEEEWSMRTLNEVKKSIENNSNSVLIFVGDECQLRNEMDKTTSPISIEYFKSKGANVITLKREGDRRQNFEYGTFLDTLRNNKDIKAIANTHYSKIPEDELFFSYPNIPKIISGDHKRVSKFNRQIRDYLKTRNIKKIDVKHITTHKISKIHIDNKDIWWDKNSMNDKPENEKYLPIFAETIDAVQGQTLDSIILDINHLTRYGALYTGLTRTRKKEDTYIL